MPNKTVRDGHPPHHRKNGCRSLVVTLLGLTLPWHCACSRSTPADPQAAQVAARSGKIPIGVVTAQRKDLTRTITLLGTLVAFSEATLYGKVAGYVKSVPVDKGDKVRGRGRGTRAVPR